MRNEKLLMACRMTTFVAVMFVLSAGAASFDVGTGETKTLTDATISDYDGASVATGGTLILDTSEAPSFAITGAGLVRKTNAAVWTMSASSAAFTGDWEISGGIVSNGIANAFGMSGASYSLYVTNGASVVLTSNSVTIDARKVRIAGTGVGGMGALRVLKSVYTTTPTFLNSIVCVDDALLTVEQGGLFLLVNGTIDAAGHKLTVTGGGTIYALGATVGETGEIHVEGSSSARTTFSIRVWSNGSKTGKITDCDTMKFVLDGYAIFYFYNTETSFSRPLEVNGVGNELKHTEQFEVSAEDSQNHSHLDWKGPITLNSGSELKVNSDTANCAFTVSGKITGAGSLILRAYGWIYLTNPDNDYTGYTRVDDEAGKCIFGYPGSVGTWSSFTNMGSKCEIQYAAGSGQWSLKDIQDFAAAGYNVKKSVCFTDELADGGVATVSTTGARAIADGETFGAVGDTPTTFTGGSTELVPLNLVWTKGYGAVSGANPYFAKKINVQSSTGSDFATALAIDNADVTLATDGFIGSAVGSGSYSRLIITNALVRSKDITLKDTFNPSKPGTYATISNSLVVGSNSSGILEIEEGAIVSNRLQVGMHGTEVWDNTSYGGVRQRGGTMVATDPNNLPLLGNALGVGQGAGGYYELIGGKLISMGYFSVGAGGVGTMLMSGGEFVVTNPPGSASPGHFEVGSFNQGRGAFCMKGGEMRMYGAPDIYFGRGNTIAEVADFTIGGESTFCDWGSSGVYLGYGSTGGFYRFSLNGGVFRAGQVVKHSNSNRHTNNLFVVNFNGGTFRAGKAGSSFGDHSTGVGANRIFVYSGGATFDTDGFECTISTPIKAASGNGIRSIVLAAPITAVTAPIVEIASATGVGATAFAHYNWETHQVDRVDVTSAGCGYEDATVSLRFKPNNNTTVLDASAVEYGANVATGSFTKKGAGILNLSATNTYGGATILQGGMLRCYCDRAIPQNSTIELAGGTLNMNGKKMENGDACPKKWRIDVSRVRELGGEMTYDGSIQFLEGATLEIANGFGMGEEETKLTLLKTTGTLTGTPEITGTIDPKWRVVIGTTTIKYVKIKGTVLLYR